MNKYIPKHVNLYICIPRYFTQMIDFPLTFLIKNLLVAHRNMGPFTYIYNGCVLNPELMLSDINIPDGSVIIAIREQDANSNKDTDFYLKLTKGDAFENKLRSIIRKRSKAELDRLSDIKGIKVEGNINLYRQMSRKYYNHSVKPISNQATPNEKINLNNDSSEPSTEAMPILW
ncbi:hypothetical protein M9Y10_024495 [Tritrichomonas musculus]|uniref:Ubiquitin-like domain-containing protein n=1 Tax=Tritrichomonas musculus TaxID=1915356 RepID=A0ABR2HCY3_9EUKA